MTTNAQRRQWLAVWLGVACLGLVPLGRLSAQENEAETLFRSMEQKVRAAKTLQLRFDASITGADAKKWNVKGSLVLGESDQLRAETEGMLFGEESKVTFVSDGTEMKSFGYVKSPGKPKQEKTETEKSPKGIGAYFRGALPRDGFFWCLIGMDRRRELASQFTMSDFKLAGEEKIGQRNTRVIQYAVKAKGDAHVLSMKVWLDGKTNLPVKLAMTGGGSDITDISEVYGEFTVDAKVDGNLFKLPK